MIRVAASITGSISRLGLTPGTFTTSLTDIASIRRLVATLLCNRQVDALPSIHLKSLFQRWSGRIAPSGVRTLVRP